MTKTARIVAIFFVLIAAVLLSLVVFDALSFDDVKDNLSRIAVVSVIIIVATGLVALLQKEK